jgi:mRNA-degrading endonuclease toxin of MazEF toxin-antitoxin module
VNPGEVWRLEDGSSRLVLSPATYNASALNRVITAVVGDPPVGFDPFAVSTGLGTVYADRIAMHPRHWLVRSAGTVAADDMAEVRTHLRFLLL